MALDGSSDTDAEAQRASFCDNLGDAKMCGHTMSSAKDGMLNADYEAINPAVYKAELAAGLVAAIDTLFNKALVLMEENYGRANPAEYSKTFGASADPGTEKVASAFDVNLRSIDTRPS